VLLNNSTLGLMGCKLLSKWIAPFVVTKVSSYGAAEIKSQSTDKSFKANPTLIVRSCVWDNVLFKCGGLCCLFLVYRYLLSFCFLFLTLTLLLWWVVSCFVNWYPFFLITCQFYFELFYPVWGFEPLSVLCCEIYAPWMLT